MSETDEPQTDEATDAAPEATQEDAPVYGYGGVELNKTDQRRGYRLGTWHGKRAYFCATCAYSSLHENVIESHVFDAHVRPQAAAHKRVRSQLVDEQGRNYVYERTESP